MTLILVSKQVGGDHVFGADFHSVVESRIFENNLLCL